MLMKVISTGENTGLWVIFDRSFLDLYGALMAEPACSAIRWCPVAYSDASRDQSQLVLSKLRFDCKEPATQSASQAYTKK